MKVISKVSQCRGSTGRKLRRLCKAVDIPVANVYRWQKRKRDELPLLFAPGPKKVDALDLAALRTELKELNHGRKRSAGSGDLQKKYATSCSRREFERELGMARYDSEKDHQENMRRVEWKAAGMVWSMDDTEYGKNSSGDRVSLHNMQDLGSRYKMEPITGAFAKGEEVAENLRKHFVQYGAPLFMKRDWGSNLNHCEVDEVLEEFCVLPLNSPKYYSPYNGAIEKSNDELKIDVRERLVGGSDELEIHGKAYGAVAAHARNHIPRRSLKGKNSCEVFHSQKGNYRFTKRERMEILGWIMGRAKAILESMKDCHKTSTESVWRIAVEAWLRMKGYISVSIGQTVLPDFCEVSSH